MRQVRDEAHRVREERRHACGRVINKRREGNGGFSHTNVAAWVFPSVGRCSGCGGGAPRSGMKRPRVVVSSVSKGRSTTDTASPPVKELSSVDLPTFVYPTSETVLCRRCLRCSSRRHLTTVWGWGVGGSGVTQLTHA